MLLKIDVLLVTRLLVWLCLVKNFSPTVTAPSFVSLSGHKSLLTLSRSRTNACQPNGF